MKTTNLCRVVALGAALSGVGSIATAQDQTMSEIRILPYPSVNCPKDFASLDGQLMAINSNQALYSLLGTTFGGDGRTTFGLPEARGRVTVDNGTPTTFPGGTYTEGSKFGQETVSDVAQHTHIFVQGSASDGNAGEPGGAVLANVPVAKVYKTPPVTQSGVMATGTIGPEPSAPASVPNMQPSSVLNLCIAMTGIYPSRN